MDAEQDFEDLKNYCRETAWLEGTSALLEWDERTGLPSMAGNYRAEQLTYLAGLIHERRTSPALGERLQRLSQSERASDPTSPVGATIRKLNKDFRRHSRLPTKLVQAISKATVLGQQAWEKARKTDDWTLFKPSMAEVFKLRQEEADLLSDGGSRYDVLLDQYEEGASSEELTHTFAALRDELIPLVKACQNASNGPDGKSLRRPVQIKTQREIGRMAASRIGFDFQRGRLDETSHPFCSTLGPHDCRILTRYDEHFFASSFFGTLHEAGHGTYEQGLPEEWYALPPGVASGLGVHESQSRLWENFVGRSHAFWQWCFPEIAGRIGNAWNGVTLDSVYRDVNQIMPSLIRVEADEVTYNLHILIRFEIEQDLISGDLRVDDAPDAWNERYEHYLGIRPVSAANGILQDVHWSAGLVGYFPTYSLGNLYAAQLMEAATRALGDLEARFKVGRFEDLLEWLRTHVHSRGA